MATAKRISTQIKKRKQMSKQTAVEWLEQEFIALQNYGVNEFGLFEKAKEMEKQQHEKTYNQVLMSKFATFKHYWNETFNK
jgi:hypothetical protein